MITLAAWLAFGSALANDTADYELSEQKKRTSWFIDSGAAQVELEKKSDSEDFVATFYFDFESGFSILPSKGKMTMAVPAEYLNEDFVEANLADGEVFESDAFKMKLLEKKIRHLCVGLEECVLVRAYDIQAEFDLGGEEAQVDKLSFVASRVDSIPALKIYRFDLAAKVNGIAIRVGGDHVPASGVFGSN